MLLPLLRRLAISMSAIVYRTSCSLLASRMPDLSTAVPSSSRVRARVRVGVKVRVRVGVRG